ncbi:phosphate ABC transporter, membrane protein PstC [Syntrophotalea carbinolica DSM 2380]|uniref:Phosphate transport system permease protein n=1 Tax=Syntrophotalea carbinolica (strain DSM 2380 / NBRC 103641 / GraBd1) TaxID=338963 RepID=Q3A6C3_SYNC1|nr:phosphate ABC transporter permease subunit PstC [Syntrophotalea carbinolica]ABA88084.1 phosphate ABC transporter, membrane protein PstC [Syntrophotalea carbinolica DSM 2380]
MKKIGELVAERAFFLSAVASSSITIGILVFMVFMGLPLIREGGGYHLLLKSWSPYQGSFGIYPMIVGTAAISFLSLAVAFPVSLGCSFLIATIAPKPVSRGLRRIIELMTGIPTVIYGFVGIFLVVPLVREWFQSGSGMCVFTAALVLGIMISPTMTLFFSDSFDRIPRSYLDAADALGASHVQKLLYVMLPAAKKGMLNGVILALGRAVGDTLIALMLAGNAVRVPASVLEPARTLTAHIALVIAADYESPEFRSIFACGVVLYLFTMAVTFLVRYISYAEDRKP